MKNKKRSVNRNLVFALIAFEGLSLGKVGLMCDPPVTRAAISMLLSGKGGGSRLMEQISGILRNGVGGFVDEVRTLHDNDLSEVLFPPATDGENPGDFFIDDSRVYGDEH